MGFCLVKSGMMPGVAAAALCMRRGFCKHTSLGLPGPTEGTLLAGELGRKSLHDLQNHRQKGWKGLEGL